MRVARRLAAIAGMATGSVSMAEAFEAITIIKIDGALTIIDAAADFEAPQCSAAPVSTPVELTEIRETVGLPAERGFEYRFFAF